MGGRIREIKETASDAVELIRELGTPQVQESLDKVTEAAKTVREIIESFKEPEISKNIENIMAIAEVMQNAASKLEDVTSRLKQTGILDETALAVKSARNTMDSFSNSQNLNETSTAVKDMLNSIKELVDEFKLAISSSSKSGTVRNIEELVRESSDVYNNVLDDVKAAKNKK